MFTGLRRAINPPYNRKEFILASTLFFVLFTLVITLTLKAQYHQRSVQDTQPQTRESYDTSFTFTAAGDYEANNETTSNLKLIADSGASFNLALGDLSYNEMTPESAWCDYVKSHVGSTFPFQLLAGNHEDNGPDGNINNFASCLPDRIGGLTGTYAKEYYFDHRNLARFILISPDLTVDGEYYDYSQGSTRYNWVSDAIDSARSAGLQWLIVGMHKNCISMGVKSCDIGSDLMDLLVDKKVDLVLQGHDHDYQRSKQLKCATPDTYKSSCVVDDGSDGIYSANGTIFLVIGTAGRSLYNININDSEKEYFAKWMGANSNPGKGIAKFIVSSKEISAQFIGSTPGSFTDDFIIKNSPDARAVQQ